MLLYHQSICSLKYNVFLEASTEGQNRGVRLRLTSWRTLLHKYTVSDCSLINAVEDIGFEINQN